MTDQKLKEIMEASGTYANQEIVSAANCCAHCYDLAKTIYTDPKGYGQRSFVAGTQWQAEQMKELQASLKSAVDALESAKAAIAVFGVTAYGQYNPRCSSLLTVKQALKDLKAKHPDMFKGEE
jgi:hypothetical protein